MAIVNVRIRLTLALQQDKASTLERELEIRRSEVREAKDSIEEKHQKIQMLNEQLGKVKADCSTRFASELDVLHQQNRELKLQAEKLEYKLSQMKKEAVSTLESAQNERERAEVRFIAEIESLKGRVQSLKDERSRIEKARQETESRCGVLSMQIQQLTRELSDSKELLYEHEHACDDSDRKVTELSSQLTLAMSKQQQLYRQERELRSALERMTLDHARAEREARVRFSLRTAHRSLRSQAH
jgi:chromosome segregation ATPase